VLVVLAIIVVGKTVAAFLLVLGFRYPLNTALTVSASLAQIGEFSFILARLGVDLKLHAARRGEPRPRRRAHLDRAQPGGLQRGGAHPSVDTVAFPDRACHGAARRPARAASGERRREPADGARAARRLRPVGRRIGEALIERGVPIVVAEENREIVQELRDRGIPAVSGDASEPAVLIQAHVARAQMLVIATPDTFRARKMLEIAAALRPDAVTVVGPTARKRPRCS
jgi:CPA2 family monovalent cation:H+ antiporter-2